MPGCPALRRRSGSYPALLLAMPQVWYIQPPATSHSNVSQISCQNESERCPRQQHGRPDTRRTEVRSVGVVSVSESNPEEIERDRGYYAPKPALWSGGLSATGMFRQEGTVKEMFPSRAAMGFFSSPRGGLESIKRSGALPRSEECDGMVGGIPKRRPV